MYDPRVRRHPLGFYEAIEKPSESELRDYYAKIYYQMGKGNYRTAYSPDERRCIEAKILQKAKVVEGLLASSLENRRAMLDIGCGEGFALAHFRREGWTVEGLDFSKAGLEVMNPECLDVLTTGDIFQLLHERVTTRSRYHLLWLNNVLEHVLDPVGLLRQAHSLLELGGVLVITVPNDFSELQNYLLEKGEVPTPFWISLPDHLSYFDANSLRAIGAETGYTCRRLLADFPIDWFLLHPGSNYVIDREKGGGAHIARIQLENLLSVKSIDEVNTFYESMARLGLGRQITAFFTREDK